MTKVRNCEPVGFEGCSKTIIKEWMFLEARGKQTSLLLCIVIISCRTYTVIHSYMHLSPHYHNTPVPYYTDVLWIPPNSLNDYVMSERSPLLLFERRRPYHAAPHNSLYLYVNLT